MSQQNHILSSEFIYEAFRLPLLAELPVGTQTAVWIWRIWRNVCSFPLSVCTFLSFAEPTDLRKTEQHKLLLFYDFFHLSSVQLHVVHYNSELYPNMSAAMTQRDGLAVLGIFIEVMTQRTVASQNRELTWQDQFILLFEQSQSEFWFPRQVKRRTQRLTASSTTWAASDMQVGLRVIFCFYFIFCSAIS